MNKLKEFAIGAKKFLGAASGAVAVAITAGVLSGPVEKWTVAVIAAGTAFLVYFLPPNTPPAP
jgi:hypothetical protein